MKRSLVGLDRDGTINKDSGHFGKSDLWYKELEIYPGVAEGIKLLNEKNIYVVVITNQAGVARGYFDCERVKEINKEIDKRFRKNGAKIDEWYFCPYVNKEYFLKRDLPVNDSWILPNNEGRKPKIGMLKEACRDLGLKLEETNIFVIGDKQSDVQTGVNAGGRGYLVDMKNHPEEFLNICKEINLK